VVKAMRARFFFSAMRLCGLCLIWR